MMKSLFPCCSILHVVLSLLFLFSINSVTLCSKSTVLGDGGGGSGDHYVVTRSCINSERLALLDFKSGLVGELDRLSTWNSNENNKNCCEWSGVGCSNQTGHVIELHLESLLGTLRGKIDPSLLQLRYLKYLNLCYNDFGHAPVPNFIGSFSELEHLDLSHSNFSGNIPFQLGNLSHLKYLDLSYSNFGGNIPSRLGNLSHLKYLDLRNSNFGGNLPSQLGNLSSLNYLDISFNHFDMKAENLEWLSHLSLLDHLLMDWIDLSNVTRWEGILMNLPSLSYLSLTGCNLGKFLFPYHHSDSISINSSITILDLSDNHLSPSIYHWLFKLCNTLEGLSLSGNQLTGPIPEVFGNLTSLLYLVLSINQLKGSIPEMFGNLTSLQDLDLSWNQLTGSIPETFGNLTSLSTLDLSSNQLTGTFPKSLGNLFNLGTLSLNNNQLNGSLPESMGKLKNLENFDVSFNSLEGVVSEAHFSHLSKLSYLHLSLNSIAFELSSQWVPPFQLYSIDLRSCTLGPCFPNWIQTQENIQILDISCTGISDIIPGWFWDRLLTGMVYFNISSNQIQGTLPSLSSIMEAFAVLDMSCNHFEGPIQLLPSNLSALILHNNNFSGDLSFLCHLDHSTVNFLDLSQNLFTAELPDCISNFDGLSILNFAHNKLRGKIPTSIISLHQLEVLYLYNNSFDGELPLQISNYTCLNYLNVGANKLSGNIPTWIGRKLTRLYILNLRSNNFFGTIPLELCHLNDLRVLDLSMNRLAGMIPSCFNNFTSMVEKGHHPVEGITHTYNSSYVYPMYADYPTIVWQGREQEFNKNLRFLTIIDLSSNNLTGVIPDEVALFHELVALNLSRNQLHGAIPQKIGELKSLQVLDISRNHLSGGIPASLSGLSFLNWLDMSYNNLSGRIPTSTQLQSFHASQYIGNADLCGPPLPRSCSRGKSPPSSDAEDTDEFWRWFYVGGFTGFATGFWTTFGVLLLNPRARQCFFVFLGNLSDRVCVTIELFVTKLLKRSGN